MRPALRVGLLTLAIALATAYFGWWTVPAIGALWGLLAPSNSRAPLSVAGAATLAWMILLVSVAIRGPMWELADKVGGILAIPGWLFLVLTVAFPMVLAGSAAVVSGWLRASVSRRTLNPRHEPLKA